MVVMSLFPNSTAGALFLRRVVQVAGERTTQIIFHFQTGFEQADVRSEEYNNPVRALIWYCLLWINMKRAQLP